MPLLPGASLGPYQIEALAGAGSMGEVYRARDSRLNRTVALKVLPDHFAREPGLLQRFEREARAIAAVEHANICALYDVGSDAGVNFLVMQYIEGETLADRIRRGPIPTPQAIAWAQQIAAGLDAAHMQGIVHRDLKPSNIRLAADHADQQIKLVDFGVAKTMSTSPIDLEAAATVTASPTEAGAIIGTVAYMSPEQARGLPVDKRADIWAFGCVLFEMLAGQRPFPGSPIADALAAVVGREPDWTLLPSSTPLRVRELLRRCLQKDPARRLRDIGDARLDLEEAATAPVRTLPERTGGSRWRRRAIESAVLVAAAVLATILIGGYWRSAAGVSPAAMRFSLVTNFAGVEAQPSLSPDGRSVAFVSNRDGQWDVYVGLVTGGGLVRLTNDPNFEERPRWSPDGTKLLFARLNETGSQDLWLTPAMPGPVRRLVTHASSPAWSADGRQIAYSSGTTIWIADADGRNPRQVSQLEPQPIFHDQPALSHDGKFLAFIRRRLGPRGELVHMDLGTGVTRSLTTDDTLALSPVWSPDDRFIYFSSSRGGTMNIWRVAATGADATQITAGQGDDLEIDLSVDGTRLTFSTYRANTNLVEIGIDAASRGQRKWLTKDLARSETAPRYSPLGDQIAYFTNRSGAEREGLWVMRSDGGDPTQVVEDIRTTNVYPRWSPDGQSLIYYTRLGWSGSSPPQLRRVALAGGAPEELPVKPWFPFFGWGDIRRDGRILYRTEETAGELFDPRTNQRERVTDLPGDPMWSDDGASFAYVVRGWGARSDIKQGLWVSAIGQPRRQVFPGWVIWFAWAANGDVVFLEGRPDLKGVLWRISPSGQRTEVLGDIAILKRPIDGYWIARFDIHPDGRRIVVEGLESYESDVGMITFGK